MSYATPTHVKSMFRDFATSSTPAVTDVEIQEFLDEAALVIDSALQEYYTLTITDVGALIILRKIERMMVAGIVDDILNTYGEADKKPGWIKDAKELLFKYAPGRDKQTCKLCVPIMKLPGETFLGTSTTGSTIKIKHDTGVIFEKGVDSW